MILRERYFRITGEEMRQAYSSSIRRTVGASDSLAHVRRERTGRTSSRSSRQLHIGRAVAPTGMGKDWAVIQQAIAGNTGAQEHLFTDRTGRLYRAAFSVLRNKEDAEDALQDGLCKAYANLCCFQGRSSFQTSLTRIVINSALMARRRKRVHPETPLGEILDGQAEQLPREMVEERPDPEKLCAASEIKVLVEERVRQLRPALQMAFRLCALHGLSATESSQALGISVSACKSRSSRARRKLKSRLQLPL